jgi:hypothetical protein
MTYRHDSPVDAIVGRRPAALEAIGFALLCVLLAANFVTGLILLMAKATECEPIRRPAHFKPAGLELRAGIDR